MAAKTPRQEQIEALLADDPDDPFLLYGHALEYLSAGDESAGLAGLQALLAKQPYVPAFLQAGQILARQNRAAEAREVFQRGIEVARHQGDAHAAGEMEGFLDNLD